MMKWNGIEVILHFLPEIIYARLGFWHKYNTLHNYQEYLRGWISKDFDIETPMKKLKNEFLCLGKGKLLGEMGFTKKNVILDESQCCRGVVLDWVPITGD